MEYRVKDLVKILLKKWYIILLVVCAVSAASYFLSQASFEQAKKDYAYYTSVMEQVTEGSGNTTAEYTIAPDSGSEDFMALYADFLETHKTANALSFDALELYLLEATSPELEKLVQDSNLLTSAQQAIDTQQLLSANAEPADPIVLTELVEASYLGNGKLTVSITQLPENQAKTVLDSYIAELKQSLYSPILDYQVEQTAYSFQYSDPVLSDSAELAKIVMQEPVAAPSMVRTVATAAIFSFAFICIVILVITFMRDSAALNKMERTAEAQQDQ